MRGYKLFIWDFYYPCGGPDDLVPGTFLTVAEARDYVIKSDTEGMKDCGYTRAIIVEDPCARPVGGYHIVDAETWEVVEKGEFASVPGKNEGEVD